MTRRITPVVEPVVEPERRLYKTASWFIGGVERWFVIPSHISIDQLIINGPERRISDEIACTCPSERMAEHVAMALNKVGAPK